MNDLDQTTFDAFAKRFARIERLIPEPGVVVLSPTQGGRVSRRVGFAALVVLLLATVGLASMGTQRLPAPTASAGVIGIPPDSAGPGVVLDAFLRAAVAGDCETSRALQARLLAEQGLIDLCGATTVTSFAIIEGPITVDPDKVRFAGTIGISGIEAFIPAGTYRWTYFLQRQTNGAWRLFDGGIGGSPIEPAPGPTRPTPGELQVANPELGGQGWAITEVDGRPLSELTYLSFYGGPDGGAADGGAQRECFSIAFDYAYDRVGPGITLFTRADGEGSYTNECSPTGLAEYALVTDALGRVASWRKSGPNQIELLDAAGFAVIAGGPLPPLPTPQASGACGRIPVADCQRAVALAFNFGLFPASGQTVVGWSVRPSVYTSCATQGVDPKYEVVFELANPAGESSASVGEMFGKLVACGAY